MKEYPKIQTLFNRNKETFMVTDELRCPEFGLINSWIITEKIDGRNQRVVLKSDGTISFGGKTNNADIPSFLLQYLIETFPQIKVQSVFEQNLDGTWPEVVLFGEGYGEKIQKGGGNYRKGVSFRLFDVLVGDLWLEWENVEDIANKLGIKTVPVCWNNNADLFSIPFDEERLRSIVENSKFVSVAKEENDKEITPEGIVARPSKILLDRRGNRIMWKLKFSDFRAGKR